MFAQRQRSAALLAAVLLLPACGRVGAPGPTGPEEAAAAVPVRLGRAREIPTERVVEAVGTIHGDEETTVAARVGGRVVRVLRDVGDRVAFDEPVVLVDPKDYEIALSQARRALEESLARLGLPEVPGEDFDPSRLPAVELARLQAENAEARRRRSETLRRSAAAVVSEQDYADVETAAAVAERARIVATLSARALAAEARTRQADIVARQRALDQTTVKAPSAAEVEGSAIAKGRSVGRPRYEVAERFVSVGESVQPGTPLLRLVARDPVKVLLVVPETEAALLAEGQRARLAVAGADDEVVGSLLRVHPGVDPANRAVTVEILAGNAEGRLRPGGFARATVVVGEDPHAVYVPQEALVTFAGVTKVFTVEGGKAVDVVVRPGRSRGDLVRVEGAIAGGAPVVVSGGTRLATGTPVQVLGEEPAPAPGAAPAGTPVR